MSAFVAANRNKPLWHTIGYNSPGNSLVPTFRAIALALEHAYVHGARFVLTSSDRRDSVLIGFNREHHTNLHGQGYLYDNQHRPGFYPANPPDETSHCLRSDGSPAYRVRKFGFWHYVPPRGHLPNYMLGIDAVDVGKENECPNLLAHLESLGYHVIRPYATGSEAHHFIFTSSPASVLKHWHVI